jgi:hypothetical protein
LSLIRMFWPFMDYCSTAKGRKTRPLVPPTQ